MMGMEKMLAGLLGVTPDELSGMVNNVKDMLENVANTLNSFDERLGRIEAHLVADEKEGE